MRRFALALGLAMVACGPPLRAAVSLSVVREPKTPRDAAVIIDEQYIGPLDYVASRGVRLPLGKHRISIEREGYFPYDVVVDAGDDPIRLDVKLDPIPD